jgi:uncharacterized protein (DUF2141 family)
MKRQLQAVTLVFAILGNLVLLPQANANLNGNLSVNIDGFNNQKGQVCLSLFSSSKGFPDNGKRAIKAQCIKIGQIPQTVIFPNLKAGNYAVAVIHDANGDNTLNRNSLGIPTEGFGFSQNPIIRTSAPKFGDAAVLVAGSSTDIKIQLQYFLGS